jgi:hypothetical protein
MTAKEIVLDHAPDWTEAQAQRALWAAEGRSGPQESHGSDRSALLARAAAFRARQPEVADAAALAREARDELERRGS